MLLEISIIFIYVAIRYEREAEMDFERAEKDSRFFDYCHYEYHPSDYVDKFTSMNLLLNSFEHSGCDDRFTALIAAIRNAIGLDNTVWGVKNNGAEGKAELKWEFYFYNYKKRNPDITVTKVLDAIRPIVRSNIKMNEKLPYFMFSIDITKDLDDINCVHLYFPGCDRDGGQCYNYSNSGVFLENSYLFFDAKTELAKVANKIKNTPIIDFTTINPRKILRPEYAKCYTICVSNKKTADCIYYSRIDVDLFKKFLIEFDYPKDIIDFISAHYDDVKHLLTDVGFDYFLKDGKLKIHKSGYYGTF